MTALVPTSVSVNRGAGAGPELPTVPVMASLETPAPKSGGGAPRLPTRVHSQALLHVPPQSRHHLTSPGTPRSGLFLNLIRTESQVWSVCLDPCAQRCL